MDHLRQKTFTTSRSLTYTYYQSTSIESAKPTLLFLHGWPDSAHLWASLSSSITDISFPVLIPDLLGYGGTSKPPDASVYNSKSMTSDLSEIIDAEGIDRVIVIGHDWGSFLAQRFYLFHPAHVAGIILLNVAYNPPIPNGPPFDLNAMLERAEKNIGRALFAYWQLFTAPDGPKILQGHLNSLWTALHAADDGWMKGTFCTRGVLREFLLADKQVPVKHYAQNQAAKEAFISRMQRDGFEGPQCWYRAMTENNHYEVEKSIPPESLKVNVPMLFIGCTNDPVCPLELIRIPESQGLLPDLTVKEIESGHWATMEKPTEVEETFRQWLKRF
jgi:soluble epoxide hydrolase/lipid-phosphate phosphatase